MSRQVINTVQVQAAAGRSEELGRLLRAHGQIVDQHVGLAFAKQLDDFVAVGLGLVALVTHLTFLREGGWISDDWAWVGKGVNADAHTLLVDWGDARNGDPFATQDSLLSSLTMNFVNSDFTVTSVTGFMDLDYGGFEGIVTVQRETDSQLTRNWKARFAVCIEELTATREHRSAAHGVAAFSEHRHPRREAIAARFHAAMRALLADRRSPRPSPSRRRRSAWRRSSRWATGRRGRGTSRARSVPSPRKT